MDNKKEIDHPVDRDQFFTQIYQKHHKALLLYAYGLCKGSGQVYKDDLMQEFYIKILHKYQEVHQEYQKKGISYLCKMLYNRFIDGTRHKKSIERVERAFAQRRPATCNIHHLCIDVYTEEFQRIMARLLKPSDVAIMTLYIQGYSYDEIAEELDMPKNTVGTRIYRSKKILTKYFDEDRN